MIEVLDFYAEWCGPCQMMKPIFAELERQYQDKVKFTVIDVDKEPQRSSEMYVLSIPTYVIMKDGKEVDRLIGFTPKPAFEAKLNAHLTGVKG
jgi:thioredoxin 1